MIAAAAAAIGSHNYESSELEKFECFWNQFRTKVSVDLPDVWALRNCCGRNICECFQAVYEPSQVCHLLLIATEIGLARTSFVNEHCNRSSM